MRGYISYIVIRGGLTFVIKNCSLFKSLPLGSQNESILENLSHIIFKFEL